MAHFAKLNDNNVVIGIHVVSNDVLLIDGNESEQLGVDFLTELYGHTNWKQTSYNGSFRKNYAAVGYTYNDSLDAFIPPCSFTSWNLNEISCTWQAPVAYPTDGKVYGWNEENLQWVEIKG